MVSFSINLFLLLRKVRPKTKDLPKSFHTKSPSFCFSFFLSVCFWQPHNTAHIWSSFFFPEIFGFWVFRVKILDNLWLLIQSFDHRIRVQVPIIIKVLRWLWVGFLQCLGLIIWVLLVNVSFGQKVMRAGRWVKKRGKKGGLTGSWERNRDRAKRNPRK